MDIRFPNLSTTNAYPPTSLIIIFSTGRYMNSYAKSTLEEYCFKSHSLESNVVLSVLIQILHTWLLVNYLGQQDTTRRRPISSLSATGHHQFAFNNTTVENKSPPGDAHITLSSTTGHHLTSAHCDHLTVPFTIIKLNRAPLG